MRTLYLTLKDGTVKRIGPKQRDKTASLAAKIRREAQARTGPTNVGNPRDNGPSKGKGGKR